MSGVILAEETDYIAGDVEHFLSYDKNIDYIASNAEVKKEMGINADKKMNIPGRIKN